MKFRKGDLVVIDKDSSYCDGSKEGFGMVLATDKEWYVLIDYLDVKIKGEDISSIVGIEDIISIIPREQLKDCWWEFL